MPPVSELLKFNCSFLKLKEVFGVRVFTFADMISAVMIIEHVKFDYP